MKKRFVVLLATLFMLLCFKNGYAVAGSWLQADTAKARVWVNTSHWEAYQAWVDTSHYEWRPYQVWVSSGYWTSQYWESGWNYINFFYDDDVIDWQESPEHLVLAARASSDQRARDWYNKVCSTDDWWTTSSSTMYYGPYSNGDGSFRTLRRIWYSKMEKRGTFWRDYKLYSKSYGYETKSYGWSSVWVDTSHWETRWGWVWVPSGHYETRYQWVVSGYWDEAHGQVSVSKTPTYIFTASHQMANGEPAGMTLQAAWKFNKNVTRIHVYHDLERYQNKGIVRVEGAVQSLTGLYTGKGQGVFRLEYPKPGTANSRLYLEFTFADKTSAGVWAYIPVNGYNSTQKDKSQDPVWLKSIQNSDAINF